MKNIIVGYGNVGKLIAQEMKDRGEDVVVARHSEGSVEGYATVHVDLLNHDSVIQAMDGADRIFITTGLPYKLKVWQREWPIIIDNIIAAAKQAQSKIIFIDNIYLYGPSPLLNPITETHPRSPLSKKGVIRLALINKLEAAMQDGTSVLIVRCADFYGPRVNSSGVTMAIEATLKGKTGYFMGEPTTKHTYSYVPDIAKATVELARAGDTYNQTWHVPSAPAITGTKLMTLVDEKLGKKGKWSLMNRNSMAFMGLFVPVLRELREMMYQFENDYVFDSGKFSKRFPSFKVTSYEDGVQKTIDAAKKPKS